MRLPPHDPSGRIDYGLYACVDANLATPGGVVVDAPQNRVSRAAASCSQVPWLTAARRGSTSRPPTFIASELTAAGTFVQKLSVIKELLAEWHVVAPDPPPLYVDSESTVLVGNSEASVRRSVWTIRRAVILQEAVAHCVCRIVKISEKFNLADIFTKYLPYHVWIGHVTRLLNSIGQPPPPPIDWRV